MTDEQAKTIPVSDAGPHASASDGADAIDPSDAPVSDLDVTAAIEAVLMVVDEPVATVTLAQVLQQPEVEVAAACVELAARVRGRMDGDLHSARSRVDGASTAVRPTQRSLSASSSTVSRPA